MDWSRGRRTIDRIERAWEEVLARVQGRTFMLVVAMVVGLVTGVLAWALIESVRLVQLVAFGTGPVGPLRVLVVPTAGAFTVGLLVTYVLRESSGSGVVETMRTVAIRGGRFRWRVPGGGIAASGLALGTGASGGREGPIVLIGGSVGSILGQWAGVDESRIRGLVAAGTAAGIGASFNAPIGGMLFAVELIIGGFRAASLQAVVVASVVGSVTARQLVGSDIVFGPQGGANYVLQDPRELVLYGLLGLVAAAVGLAYLHGVDLGRRVLRRWQVWPPLRIAAGGAAVGVIALLVPEILGTGDRLPPIDGIRDPIQRMIDGSFVAGWETVGFLLLLAAVKVVATAFSVGSGNAVGSFAPIIFSGAATGGAFGYAASELLPGAGVEPGAFALVGMAAAFGAAARGPLTAIVLVFELTGDYGLVLPLMLATTIATFLADRVEGESVFTLPLQREGIVYTEPEDIDILQTVQVGEIMTADPDVVPADLPVAELRRRFHDSGHHGFPVVEDGDRLLGVVTLADLERAPPEREGLTAGDICTRDPVTVTPEQPAFRAVARMGSLDVGRVPVVRSDDRHRLVGLVRRADLVKAYRRAVARNVASQQRRESSQLRDLVGVHFVELSVRAEAPAAGRPIREIEWPARTVLTSIRRGGDVITPNGDTVLEVGDEVVALTAEEATDTLRSLLAPDADPADTGDGTAG